MYVKEEEEDRLCVETKENNLRKEYETKYKKTKREEERDDDDDKEDGAA
jgi:hypothetical protein